MAFVVVSQKLGLVGGHIDTGRALLLATLARQTHVQRFVDSLVVPTTGKAALGHLLQQVRAPARAVLLASGHHVTWTHSSTLIHTGALAHAHATPHGSPKAVVIIRIMKVRLRPRRSMARPEGQMAVQGIGIDDLAGVHVVAGIPRPA